jgi:hypothetical protein
MSGVIFYEGPSRLDGEPIVAIATEGSKNGKTGQLVQTWIMRSDVSPMAAINDGDDASVCGNCPMRGVLRPASERLKKPVADGYDDTVNKGRSCYVNVAQAPLAIWRAYKAGKYPKLAVQEHRRLFMGRGLRYGSYGDPVAVPLKAWKPLETICTGEAEPGYSHQWQDRRFQAWRKKLMASTHTEAENAKAWGMGWRTFRTITKLEERTPQEIVCPASKEAGYKATCETCGACNGRRNMNDRRASVVIVGHGGSGKLSLVGKIIEDRGGNGRVALPMA